MIPRSAKCKLSAESIWRGITGHDSVRAFTKQNEERDILNKHVSACDELRMHGNWRTASCRHTSIHVTYTRNTIQHRCSDDLQRQTEVTFNKHTSTVCCHMLFVTCIMWHAMCSARKTPWVLSCCSLVGWSWAILSSKLELRAWRISAHELRWKSVHQATGICLVNLVWEGKGRFCMNVSCVM